MTGKSDPPDNEWTPFEPDEKGNWALHYAVMKGDPERVPRYVVERGHPVDARDGQENTPLHWAIWNRKLMMVEPLLEQGADPNAANYKGHAMLHHLFARIQGSSDLVFLKKLLERKADPLQPDKKGNTAYHALALGTFRSAEAAARLAEHLSQACGMAGWSIPNKAGLVPIECARTQGSDHWMNEFSAAIEYSALNIATAQVSLPSKPKSRL